MAGRPSFERSSFRDRSGRVFQINGQIYRALSESAMRDWETVASRPFLKTAIRSGHVVKTEQAPSMNAFARSEGFALALHHERIPFLSWPYEWCFSMLREAALLQLDLMEKALAGDSVLKDASAFNIQFRGTQPVLIDTGSIIPLQPGQPWEGYRQFCEMFLFPLMLQAWKGVDFQPWLRGSPDGIATEQFSRLLSLRDMFRRGALTHVWLHARLQGRPQSSVRVAESMQNSGFNKSMIQNNVAGLKRVVQGLNWNPRQSTWSSYDVSSEPVQRDAGEKETFIDSVCAAKHWNTVWDLGCNQGRYSRIAAKHADLVVAVDSDHLTVDRLFRSLHYEENTTIVPMVANLANPSPSLGWRSAERPSLEQRSKPDLVFCLALIHHLVIGSNLLLADVIDWLASLDASIVIEFVDRDDPQVRQLLANRQDVFSDYTLENFSKLIAMHFEVQREHVLPSGARTLFFLHPRQT